MFWVIETIKEASATNSIMILSHTLYVVITDAKALFSILYSFRNIQIKNGPTCPSLLFPPSVTLSWQKTSVSIGLTKTPKWNSCNSRFGKCWVKTKSNIGMFDGKQIFAITFTKKDCKNYWLFLEIFVMTFLSLLKPLN